MSLSNQMRFVAIIVLVAIMAALSACRGEKAAPLPTRTPAPTFTPTVAVAQAPIDPAAAATAKAAQPVAEQPVGSEPAAGDQVVVQPPPEAPATDTPPPPTPALAAELVINTTMNVRGGPGTNYNIVGSANSGERYSVQGKNDASSWWQIDFQGQHGWVFNDLVSAQNTGSVAVAQNIPAPPPTLPPPPPTNTPARHRSRPDGDGSSPSGPCTPAT